MSQPSAPWTTIWKRHDLRGYEACRVTQGDRVWQVSGAAVFVFDNRPCCLNYEIWCDREWITGSAFIRGWVDDRRVDQTIMRDNAGTWQLNGKSCESLAGCFDLDLNFSPSTNLLPIRRLDLGIGESAQVRA